jgi:hypothetical protein
MKRKSINVDEKFNQYVDEIYEVNGEYFSKAMCIRMALRYCAENKVQFFANQPQVSTMTIAGARTKEKAQSKEDWCTAFGGEVKNGVCEIYKYETLFSGHVSKDLRVQSIASFPMDRAEFKKSVLEKWETVEEAEAAYKAKPIS